MPFIDTYLSLLSAHGGTHRERNINILKRDVLAYAKDNPAYKAIQIGDKTRYVVVNSMDDMTVKEIVVMPNDDRIPFGEIIKFGGKNWIVTYSDFDNEIYSKARMQLCACVLKFKRDDVVYSYPAYVEDATKYSEGVDSTKYIGVGEFQLKAKIHMDEISSTIFRDMRFIIDVDKYVPDIIAQEKRPYVYRVTRRNIVTGSYDDEGYIEITLVQDQWIEGKDDYINMIAAQPDEIKKPYPPESDEESDGSSLSPHDSGSNVSGWL